ncbi:MAG: VOC family protein [Alphaproteobacteria bacterium]|nr:VOC family protein [Alphaproteobacteria bacterium]
MTISPYLCFAGNCREAFDYYLKHIGGKIDFSMTYADSPEADKNPPGADKQIMHMRGTFAGTMLMASDAVGDCFAKAQGVRLSLAVDSTSEAERLFKALSDGGVVDMPFGETFYAHGFGMMTDKFGTPWMVIHSKMPA